ncbi:uncharacterized protein LOC120305681 [Crotalus tigris]|uniref:uncharacterized protein LOC120305681 n=1 Tax=Crotalus tigris TaxID=88082 RepID=UPI00192F795C|nr:uncharacterized protein LOC120305681 [Crotalus tigris]
MAGPEVALAVGPLFVLDPQRGNGAQSPGEPAEEEMAMEELIPAVSKITHPPFREQWGSSKVPGDPKDHLGLSLEAFVQQGPIFFTGEEGGSGFGDPTEAVTGSVRRKQPMVSLPQRATALVSTLTPARQSKAHFSATERSALAVKAEILPSPLEDTVASTAVKLPKEALNMAAKDGKPVPGWPLLLLPTGAAVVALLSLVVWLLVRRRRRGGLPGASPVSLELQCK